MQNNNKNWNKSNFNDNEMIIMLTPQKKKKKN